MRKKAGMVAVAIIVVGIIGLWATESVSKGGGQGAISASLPNSLENTNGGGSQGMILTPLPKSLDQYYPSGGPPIFLLKMLDMADSLDDTTVNLQENDLVNATNSFQEFSNKYDNVSKMIPEWSVYFDKSLVAKISSEIDTGDVPNAFADIGKLGETCDKCHKVNTPEVWAKYYWKDFDSINVTTVNPNEPVAPWSEAMAKYLTPGFEGMITNLKERKGDAANQSFENFRSMLLNFKKACSKCHNTERKYFVSDDIMAVVNQTGDYVKSGNVTGVEQNVQIIGMESCYKCHVLHQPAQMMKDLMRQ